MNTKQSLKIIALMLIGIFWNTLNAQILKDSVRMLSHKELSLKRYKIFTPYIVELKHSKKHLTIVGSKHSNNPNDPLFITIDSLFHKTNPQFALNEGGEFQIFSTRDSTILNSLEPGYLIYLCKQAEVLRKSIEPDLELELALLFKSYTKEEVFLFYAYRNAIQLKRQKRNLDNMDVDLKFSKYLNRIGKSFLEKSTTKLTYKQIFDSLYKKQFNIDFEFKDLSYSEISPLKHKSNLNQLNRDIADFRDQHMINEIQHYLAIYDRVFVVLGASHVVRQEPVIRDFFEKTFG